MLTRKRKWFAIILAGIVGGISLHIQLDSDAGMVACVFYTLLGTGAGWILGTHDIVDISTHDVVRRR